MTAITAHNGTPLEGAGATEFEVESTDTRQVDSVETVQVDPAPGAVTSAPQTPAQPQAPAKTPQGSAFAITSFVLGLASIVSGWTFFAPIVGLVLGILALRRGTSERTLALWGVWLNGVILALSLIGVVVFGAMVGAGMIMLPILAA